MFFCYHRRSTGSAIYMTSDTLADRRSGDRRSDGVTAKILHAVFAMRRGFGSGAAKHLLLRHGHDDAFIERILTIPEERRGQRRRADAGAAPSPADTVGDGAPVTLGASAMAILHRLRFEADSGMHRMAIADCPAELTQFALIQQERDGRPTITSKGRQALRHFGCVRALGSLCGGAGPVPMSDDIKAWLEANLFLQRDGNAYSATELGRNWLRFNDALSSPSTTSMPPSPASAKSTNDR